MFQMNRLIVGASLLCSMLMPAQAAERIDLERTVTPLLTSFAAASTSSTSLKEISRERDFNQTTHIRLQQTYQNYPVWGADIVMHVPSNIPSPNVVSWQSLAVAKSHRIALNGAIYQNLTADLKAAPAYLFTAEQANKVVQVASQLYQKKSANKHMIQEPQAKLIVYVDETHKAHWAFLVSFLMQTSAGMPARPHYIMDAVNFSVYRHWNNIQTAHGVDVGGYGGNPKMGKRVYDGVIGHAPKLNAVRVEVIKTCFLQNADVKVLDAKRANVLVSYPCKYIDNQHQGTYWDGELESANGGFSPSNDALFTGKIVKDMYQTWYGIPVLTQNGLPIPLVMRVHGLDEDGQAMDNAYWDGNQMTFGDGDFIFYPLVSMSIAGHEISHGFTEQHSGLIYEGQSGALNESFSDMAGEAAEFYATGQNSWMVGADIIKIKLPALRFMDEPTKDCAYPILALDGECSISHVNDYTSELDVHHSSGVFNKAFYLLATTPGWDTKKAFDVMVQANRYYWTPTVSFADAACGVKKASRDYNYDSQAIDKAMAGVGLDTTAC